MPSRSFVLPAAVQAEFGRFGMYALWAGAAAAVLSVISGFFGWLDFLQAYLAAWLLWLGVSLGSLILVATQYLTGGAWGVMIRRPAEAAARTLPLVAILFLPIAFGIPVLYHWSHPELVAHDEILRHKHIWMNTPAFLIRAAAYFAIWIGIGALLERWSLRQDATGDPKLEIMLQRLSAPAIVIYGGTISFAAVDWVVSLSDHWYSTIIGFLFIAEQGLSSLSFLIIVMTVLAVTEPVSEYFSKRHLQDLGKLLLMFVMLWAYFAFSQLLIIWAGNTRQEITWYYPRMATNWGWVGLAMILLQFCLPFLLLLSRDLKRNRKPMIVIAGIVLFMRYVGLYWSIKPDVFRDGIRVTVPDVLLPLAIGGIWLSAYLYYLRRYPILPEGSPHLEGALAHGH
ncbi:MAG: hypothetical protein M3Z09_07020 [Acidobacteriota bacterium]|nr:hypothetical protein [Acidobacteriota bacterium]